MTSKETQRPRWSESFRVRVAPEVYAETKRLARERESTVSAVTRHALRRYLEEQKR
jgi:predicted transcriptional regulator